MVLFLWANPRGRWKSASGDEGYRACFGAPPPPGLLLIRSEAVRHYKLTGELLALECYVQAEGEFDTSGSGWRDARTLGAEGGLDSVLRGQGLTRVPAWFRAADGGGRAKVAHSAEGRLVSIYPIGEDGLLIAGGWLTKAAR